MQKNQDSLHNCEACKDTGFMLYEKKHSDAKHYYTTATYCTCERGQKMSDGHRRYFADKRDKVNVNKNKEYGESDSYDFKGA